MNARHLVLDLETITDPELPPPPNPPGAPELFPAPLHHQVVSFGCMLLEDYKPVRMGCIGAGKTERERLHEFAHWYEQGHAPTLVTFSGHGFDLPVIEARLFRWGLALPSWFQRSDTRYRFASGGHLDLADFLSNYGASRKWKLDSAAKAIGFPGKLEVMCFAGPDGSRCTKCGAVAAWGHPLPAPFAKVDGSHVAEMVAAGRLADVDRYCLTDVAQTAAVLLRVQLLKGVLNLLDYCVKAQDLIRFLEAREDMKELLAQTDVARFTMVASRKEEELSGNER